MERDLIIAEIKRTAAENGGAPLGRRRFEAETGIKESDWYGKLWTTWGLALQEAGFSPNEKREKLSDHVLLDQLAKLTRELGRFPVYADLRMKARAEQAFPSHNTFRRFGGRTQLAARLLSYCESTGERADVISICRPIAAEAEPGKEVDGTSSPQELASVYLIKAGRYYKVGRSNAPGRREYELAIRLPEKPKTVHIIRTDDPVGIEAYWHNRFADKRKNGEWFQLTHADVQAFRRRKFM
jgi:hypothetical protein